WFIVGWIIIFINQRADALLAKYVPSIHKPLKLRYVVGKGLFAPLFWFGIALFMLGMTAWLGWGYDLEQIVPDERANFIAVTRKLFLSSSLIIAPIDLLAWVHMGRDDGQPSPEHLAAWLREYPSPELEARLGMQIKSE